MNDLRTSESAISGIELSNNQYGHGRYYIHNLDYMLLELVYKSRSRNYHGDSENLRAEPFYLIYARRERKKQSIK